MDCKNFKDKIISYIENELSEVDRIEFEKQLELNPELKNEFNEVNGLLNSLNNLPVIKTSSDFIVSLNQKIEAYENIENQKSYSFINKIAQYLDASSSKFALAGAAIVCILSITYFWDSMSSRTSQSMLSKSSAIENAIDNQVVDADSLFESNTIVND